MAAAVGNDVTEAMAASLSQFNLFVSALRELQAQVIQDQQEEWKRSREVHGQHLLDLQNSISRMMKSFRQGTKEAAESVSKLKQVCRRN
jgi:signal transduction histidine kinase